jgi:hypothetical protein
MFDVGLGPTTIHRRPFDSPARNSMISFNLFFSESEKR